MTSWGDVNVVMNRLVREGVIESFRTNRAQKAPDLGLQVFIVLPKAAQSAEEIHNQVVAKLGAIADDVVVTVDHSEAGAA